MTETTSVFLNDAAPTAVNVMLDLETWGTSCGCALRSIGAVMFDPHTDEIGETFYANIDKASCVEFGLVIDRNTEEWWSKQSQQAQDSLTRDPLDIAKVANDFHSWVAKQRGIFVWSQGANFDEPIWTYACRVVDRKNRLIVHNARQKTPWPWFFWDTRCTRTAYDMGGFNPKTIRRVGTAHNALDDAIHQARCVQASYKNLKSKNLRGIA